MEQQKIDMYLMTNQNKFPAEKIMLLRSKLQEVADDKFNMLPMIELKEPTTLTIISVLLGGWGVDRFMMGEIGMGILKILTGGCCGILAIYDMFTMGKKAKEENFNKVMAYLYQ